MQTGSVGSSGQVVNANAQVARDLAVSARLDSEVITKRLVRESEEQSIMRLGRHLNQVV